jgi:broad specificity phosphatase PhoE
MNTNGADCFEWLEVASKMHLTSPKSVSLSQIGAAVFVSYGETIPNDQHTFIQYALDDRGLTKRGLEQAANTARELVELFGDPYCIVCAPFQRSREAAEAQRKAIMEMKKKQRNDYLRAINSRIEVYERLAANELKKDDREADDQNSTRRSTVQKSPANDKNCADGHVGVVANANGNNGSDDRSDVNPMVNRADDEQISTSALGKRLRRAVASLKRQKECLERTKIKIPVYVDPALSKYTPLEKIPHLDLTAETHRSGPLPSETPDEYLIRVRRYLRSTTGSVVDVVRALPETDHGNSGAAAQRFASFVTQYKCNLNQLDQMMFSPSEDGVVGAAAAATSSCSLPDLHFLNTSSEYFNQIYFPTSVWFLTHPAVVNQMTVECGMIRTPLICDTWFHPGTNMSSWSRGYYCTKFPALAPKAAEVSFSSPSNGNLPLGTRNNVKSKMSVETEPGPGRGGRGEKNIQTPPPPSRSRPPPPPPPPPQNGYRIPAVSYGNEGRRDEKQRSTRDHSDRRGRRSDPERSFKNRKRSKSVGDSRSTSSSFTDKLFKMLRSSSSDEEDDDVDDDLNDNNADETNPKVSRDRNNAKSRNATSEQAHLQGEKKSKRSRQ